jgi:hypothetical protein
MSSQIDFKSLYQSQGTGPVPDVNDVVKKAASLKRKTLIKMLTVNGLLACTVGLIVLILAHNPSRDLTTKLGSILIIMATVSYLAVSNRTLSLLFKELPDLDNCAFLNVLITIQSKQRFLHKTMHTVYFILLSVGILLAMIGDATKMSLINGILIYSGVIIWIGFNWLVIMPKSVKKQEKEFSDVLDNLHRISAQLRQ